jgi:hypothetical protein
VPVLVFDPSRVSVCPFLGARVQRGVFANSDCVGLVFKPAKNSYPFMIVFIGHNSSPFFDGILIL